MNFLTYLTICVVTSTQINHGTSIEDGLEGKWSNFRYMASIWYRVHGRHRYICSGSIVSRKHILTAAHCVFNRAPGDFYVVTGVANIADIDLTNYEEPPAQSSLWSCITFAKSECATISQVSNIASHELYRLLSSGPIVMNDFSYPANDIAVMVLDSELPRRGNDKIKLPNRNIVYDQDCTVAGWGMTNACSAAGRPSPILTYALYITMPMADCVYDHRPNEFCADPIEGFALKGDSGSPLVCNGVAVGVLVNGNDGFPAVFINTYMEREFIEFALQNP